MSDHRPTTTDRRTILKTTGAIGALAGVGAVTSASASRNSTEIIVSKNDRVSISDIESTVETVLPNDATITHRNDVLGYVVAEVPESEYGVTVDLVSTLESRSEVKYAHENGTMYALESPLSPNFRSQNQPNDPGWDQQYAPQMVNAPDAWNVTHGEDALISIVDTGTDYDHEDLHAGFGSDPGHDFVGGTSDPAPRAASESHGTHVAGCAAATTDNGVGVAGPSNAQLIAARVLGTDGSGSMYDIADGIQYSADRGADIINLSLGSPSPSPVTQEAMQYALNQGSLPIAAAGNSGGSVGYPAAYPEAVAVAAIDSNGDPASFTSRGPEIAVCAPGVDVLAPVPFGDSYDRFSGTSMASPVAAGVAALGASAHGLTGNNKDPQQLRNLLRGTADSIGLPGSIEGDGLVNAAAIVDGGGGDPPEEPTAVIDVSTTTPEVGETVDLDGTSSSSPNGSIDEYHWNAQPGGEVTSPTATLTRDEEIAVDVTLTVTDTAGASASDTVTIVFGGDDDDDDPEPGECGEETNTASASGSLDGGWYGDTDNYTYDVSTANPCDATVTLSTSEDFDLLVTTDVPTQPARSTADTANADEITVDLDGVDNLGIVVRAGYFASGEYELDILERGK
ncbi:S8 family serine peptidase [Halovivax gelatinilyticus]|uniref:S8 family serine peptidase n=1 Tax=Halovivax gelatinilyticus TaxID=2961597 RepID=UPI0020CA92EE|nr:S8 family serine peptidase [Halovivax gelatinilyticus]